MSSLRRISTQLIQVGDEGEARLTYTKSIRSSPGIVLGIFTIPQSDGLRVHYYLLIVQSLLACMAIPHQQSFSLESQPLPRDSKDDFKETPGHLDDFIPATAAEEAAVIRKLDWHLLPFVFLLYMLSVLDRSNLGNAKLAGMEDEINLAGFRYNWLGTIFYVACKYSTPYLRASSNEFDRYLLTMDMHWLEGVCTSPLLRFRSTVLGFRVDHTSSGLQLARSDGVPLLPWYCR